MQRGALAFLVVIVVGLAVPARGGSSTTSFTFETPPPPPNGFGPLPATFSQGGLMLHAASALGRIAHTDVFSLLFDNISGGALVDGFRLTPLPGYPPETLILDFSAPLQSFTADFGVILDFGVVAHPIPTSLRLEAFSGEDPRGVVIVSPHGGPAIYEGIIAFSVPAGSGGFDRVLLTSLPAAPDAGGLSP